MNGATMCERAIEVEDLVLGLVTSESAVDELTAHVETCADCKEAREMFLAERALFGARPAPPAPELVLPKPPLVRRLGGHRIVPAVAAMAACMAAFLGGHHRADDCDEPVPVKVVATTADDPAICRAPTASWEAAPAVSLASHDPAACVPSPNATCDVTSSTAMP